MTNLQLISLSLCLGGVAFSVISLASAVTAASHAICAAIYNQTAVQVVNGATMRTEP